MKNPTRLLLAAFWLGLTLTLAGLVVAQSPGITSSPRPLIVKNGPGPNQPPDDNKVGTGSPEAFSIQSSSGGATNLHLKAYLATIVQSGGDLYLSNSSAGPSTNCFVVPGGSGYFDGNATLPLKTTGDYWETVDYQLDATVFPIESGSDSLLLMLGRAERSGMEYQAAFALVVDAPGTSTNICTPVETARKEEPVNPGVKRVLGIWRDEGGNTNSVFMNLRAYLANVSTNETGDFYLQNISGNLDGNALETGGGLFDGVTPVELKPDQSNPVSFVLKEDYFTDNEFEDCQIVFVGVTTNSGVSHKTAYILPVGSPFSTTAKKAPEEKK